MNLSRKEVENVATLARLKLTDEEKDIFSHQLNDILLHIDKLNRLSAEEVDLISGDGECASKNRFRLDTPRSPFFSGDLMANAPEKDGRHFKVPKIID